MTDSLLFCKKLHGTYRQKDRIYREDIYYGHGKKLEDATRGELAEEIEERESENPLAYGSNVHEFELDLKKTK